MNFRPALISGLAAACLAATVAPMAGAASVPAAAEDRPVLIGHRGSAGTAPENTVAAFKDGRASGADFFEIDVQLSKDGVPFLFHDDTPARTTNVEEVFPGRENDPVTSFTWAELQQLDAGSYFSSTFAGEKIPHFDDAARVGTTQTGVFIEIKSPKNSAGVERLVADALHHDPQWTKLVDAGKIEVLGFDAASNRRFAELAPEIPLQQLNGTVPDAATLASYAEFADAFGTSYRTLDAAGVQRVQDSGLGLGVYTVNSVEAVQHVVDLGVERVTGDFPIQMERYLDGLAPFPAGSGVVVEDSVNNPAGNDLQPETGEHVVLRNEGRTSVDVGGYILRDAANNILRVGEGYVLEPGAELRVYTGPGTDSADAFYNAGTANVLNNGGDSVALWSAQGTLQDSFAN